MVFPSWFGYINNITLGIDTHVPGFLIHFLETTFFIQRFLTFFIYLIKNAFLNVFYSWDQRFYHLWEFLIDLISKFAAFGPEKNASDDLRFC